MSIAKPDEFEALRTISQTLEPFSTDDQARILRWMSEKLGISPAAHTLLTTTPPITPPPAAPGGRVDIKSFVAAKQPKNDTQFAAVVAYYYRFEAAEQKEAISKDDLLAACRLVGRDRPPAPGQTLRNAMNAGLLDSAERGTFAINSVGENLVAVTLPGDGSASSSGGSRHKRSAKKAQAGKRAAKKGSPQKTISKKAPPKKK